MRYAIVLLIAGAVCPLFAQRAASPDFAQLGPAVGTAMPDFRAPDQNGKQRSLKDLLGPKGALILFFRSADW